MLNIYRRIRRKLAYENKFFMYSRYAIGEIVLVVVGILIALSIDNANDIRKNEKEFVLILKDVHKDLESNINDAVDMVTYYREKDSLITLALNDKLSEEDYARNSSLFSLATHYPDYKVKENGFNNLMEYTHDIPDRYQSIIADLKTLYIDDKNLYDIAYKKMADLVTENVAWMEENTTWLHELFLPDTDESIHRRMDFYLASSRYKNMLFSYSQYGLGNHFIPLIEIRRNAIICHRELTELLGLEAEVQVNPQAYKINIEDYVHYAGTYENPDNNLEIRIEGDRIYSQLNDNEKVEEFPLNSSELFLRGFFTRLIMSEDQQADTLLIKFGGQRYAFKKTE